MRVLAVTGTRADWGLLAPLLDRLRDDPRFVLQILATGQHLMEKRLSLIASATDGHRVDWQVDMGLGTDDGPEALAVSMGRAIAGMGAALADSAPDLVVVLGDRYEILACVLAATVARVPVAHLFGGDVTEGAIDDSIRHAITKLSALHFVSNAESAARIVQMGENPAYVFNVGSTGIDRILSLKPMNRADFFAAVGLEPQPRNFVLTFHPATLAEDSTAEAKAMLSALDRFGDAGLIFTGSNADPGAREIDALVQEYAARRGAGTVFHASLGSRLYFSALSHCDMVIGNSSSGLIEAPSFGLPTVNIGLRQKRRPRAASVIDAAAEPDAIAAAIARGLALDCRGTYNPYGDGKSAARIVEILAAQSPLQPLIRKSFRDIAYD